MKQKTVRDLLDLEARQELIDIADWEDPSSEILGYCNTILLVNRLPMEQMHAADGKILYDYNLYVPVGLTQTHSPVYERNLSNLGEIGSAANIVVPDDVSKSMSLGRLLHKKRSILKALYRGTLRNVDLFKKNKIFSDVTMPMFTKPFILMKLIIEPAVTPVDNRTVIGIVPYIGCTCTSVGRTIQVGARVLTEGATITWQRTIEQKPYGQPTQRPAGQE